MEKLTLNKTREISVIMAKKPIKFISDTLFKNVPILFDAFEIDSKNNFATLFEA